MLLRQFAAESRHVGCTQSSIGVTEVQTSASRSTEVDKRKRADDERIERELDAFGI